MKPQTLSPSKVNFKRYIWKNTSKFNFNFNHLLDNLSFNLKIYFNFDIKIWNQTSTFIKTE